MHLVIAVGWSLHCVGALWSRADMGKGSCTADRCILGKNCVAASGTAVAPRRIMSAVAFSRAAPQPTMSQSFALRFHGRSVPVREPMVIGRGPQCALALHQDPNVSRSHARVTPEGTALVVEDLGSVNGTFVNGARIHARVRVVDGDVVRVGACELLITRDDAAMPGAPPTPRFDDCDTVRLIRRVLAPALASKPHHAAFLESANDAAAVMAAGKWVEASKLLDASAWALVDEVAATGVLEPGVQERACECAVRIASATRDGMWVNFLLALHTAANRPMPRPVAASLPRLVHSTRNVEVDAVEAYVEVMRSVYPRLSPVERQLCGTLESAHVLMTVLRRS